MKVFRVRWRLMNVDDFFFWDEMRLAWAAKHGLRWEPIGPMDGILMAPRLLERGEVERIVASWGKLVSADAPERVRGLYE